jgi:formylmethanofuran dehydrogenase subunit B
MEHAWISGKPTSVDAAIAEAGKLIGASTSILITGLGTDVAGARAAIDLAQRTGAVIDHMNSESVLRDLEVMRSSGVIATTPTECHVRADTLLLAGPMRDDALNQLLDHVIGKARPKNADRRRIIWLCPGRDLLETVNRIEAKPIGREQKDLAGLLSALRAHTADRRVGKASVPSKQLQQISTILKQSRFGAAIWSSAELDSLLIEMLCGLVSDLNVTTRFSGLPLAPADNAIGVLHVCSWMTGLPVRSRFGGRFSQHDPWLFDGHRLVASGEVDCVVWISAYRNEPPPWRRGPPTIALTAAGKSFEKPTHVRIAVGRPGIDHSAVQHFAATGTLATCAATERNDMTSVAEVITRIASTIKKPRGRSC